MCAPKRPKAPPAPPPPAPTPVPTPVADTKVPELDLAIEDNAKAKKKARKKLGKKSLRTDVMVAGNSGLNIPS